MSNSKYGRLGLAESLIKYHGIADRSLYAIKLIRHCLTGRPRTSCELVLMQSASRPHTVRCLSDFCRWPMLPVGIIINHRWCLRLVMRELVASQCSHCSRLAVYVSGPFMSARPQYFTLCAFYYSLTYRVRMKAVHFIILRHSDLITLNVTVFYKEQVREILVCQQNLTFDFMQDRWTLSLIFSTFVATKY